MTTKSIVQKIEIDGIIPVLTIKHKDTAVEIVRALLEGGLKSIEDSLNIGVASGALAMTTPGDCTMATKEEVFALVKGKTQRIIR